MKVRCLLSLCSALLCLPHLFVLSPAAASVLALSQEEWITVEVEGRGASPSEAKQNAITEGVRRIVGEYIEQNTEIKDGEVVEDTIRAFTLSDQVRSEELDRRFDGDDVVVLMRVEVIPKTIAEQVEKAAASAVYIDSETLAAELDLARESMNAKKAVLRRLFEDLPVKLGVARLVDRNGKVLDGQWDREDFKNLSDGRVCVALQVQGYYDLTSYSQRALPNILMALEAMCVSKREYDVSLNNKEYSQKNVISWPGRHEYYYRPGVNVNCDPNNFIFAIVTRRTKSGDRQALTCFELPLELKPEVLLLDQYSCAKISKIDKAGNVIDWTYESFKGYTFPTRSRSSYVGSNLRVAGVDFLNGSSNSDHESSLYGGSGVIYFTPQMRLAGSYVCDTGTVRTELVMEKDEFELIDRIVVEFVEDPR